MILYHGGAPGFRAGDIIEPHETKRIDLCPVCAAGGDANHLPDRVFATPVRIYGKYYASKWVGGSLYLVEPVGDATRSDADSIETWHAPAMRVVKVSEAVVQLTSQERRRLQRMWADADRTSGFHLKPEYAMAESMLLTHVMARRLGMRRGR